MNTTYDYTEDCMDDDGSYIAALLFIIIGLVAVAGVIYAVCYFLAKTVTNCLLKLVDRCFSAVADKWADEPKTART